MLNRWQSFTDSDPLRRLDVAQEAGPAFAHKLAVVCWRCCGASLPSSSELAIRNRSQNLVQRLWLELLPRFLGKAVKLLATAAALVFVLGLHVDAKPTAKGFVNLSALDGANIVAVRT